MFNNFLVKGLINSKLKNLPEADKAKVMSMLENNPDFFKKVFEEVQGEVAKGKDQQEAIMAVMSKHQDELKNLS